MRTNHILITIALITVIVLRVGYVKKWHATTIDVKKA
jgi:hypothetical protein